MIEDTTTKLLIGIRDVASMLNVSTRHVERLNSAGMIPRPVRVGCARRWRRREIEDWVAEGCPAIDNAHALGGNR